MHTFKSTIKSVQIFLNKNMHQQNITQTFNMLGKIAATFAIVKRLVIQYLFAAYPQATTVTQIFLYLHRGNVIH
jgi:hypothetical protein